MSMFAAIVYLTLMDGSIVEYNDGKWETAATLGECQKKVGKIVEEMRVEFKDHKPAPSTFIKGCVQKE